MTRKISTQKCYKVCSEAKDLHVFSIVLRSVVELLVHVTGATIRDGVLSFDGANSKSLSEKETPIISYIPGYLFGIFYRRTHFSNSGYFSSVYYQQSLSFLMAGECKEA